MLLTIALMLAAADLTFVSLGFVRVNEPEPAPAAECAPPCVPLSQYQAEVRLAHRRLVGWRKANRKVLRLRARWRPSVDYAIALASRVEGVSESQMRAVAFCESRFDPYATNGKYRGLFQLGWSPFGFSPYEPLANALSAAQTVRQDGSWRQWQCKPGGN